MSDHVITIQITKDTLFMVEIYIVGGSLRDRLIGRRIKDTDIVVTGATDAWFDYPSGMFRKAGLAFPIYIDNLGTEWAMASRDGKTFSPDVTITEDLARRDFTINAIAMHSITLKVLDPYNGVGDICNKILRAVSANTFTDDPIRFLRLARLYAELHDTDSEWTIDHNTMALVKDAHKAGLFENLSQDRVWLETKKALQSPNPQHYFNLLQGYGIFPEYDACEGYEQRSDHHPEVYVDAHISLAVEYARNVYDDPEITWATFCHDLGKPETYDKYGHFGGHGDIGEITVTRLCKRARVPNSYKKLAILTAKWHTPIHNAFCMKHSTIIRMFEKTSALRAPSRFKKMLKCCISDAHGRGYPKSVEPYDQADYIERCLDAVLMIDTSQISKRMVAEGKKGLHIKQVIFKERLNAIRGVTVNGG